MENAYGIGVKNRYELFYDEDVDPLEIIRQQEEEKERRKTDKAKDKNKSTKAAKQSSSTVPKKAKENAPTSVSKPAEVIEPLSKPRNRAFGEKNKNTSSFDETKDSEERKNFRNREDQYFNPDSSGTFTVRNSAYKRGNPESRDNRDNRDSRDSRPDGEFRRGRGGFRGRGRGRGRGGFPNFEGRPRREFDRHSGSDKTGVRSTEKRDGAGANNWGDMKDELKYNEKDTSNSWDDNRDEFDQTVEKKDTSTNDAWGEITEDFDTSTNAQTDLGEKTGEETVSENVESKENEPAVDADAIEESVREMTLDEWKREQESKRSVPKYNLRKPGEGEDSSQWKKLYVLKKKVKDEDDDEEEEEDEDVSDEEYGRRGRHRQVVDIPINFSDSRRSRGRGRGGRGAGPRGGGGGDRGGAGGGGGGGDRGGVGAGSGSGFPSGGPSSRDRGMPRGAPKMKPTQQSAPKVDDWNDFPSLVTA